MESNQEIPNHKFFHAGNYLVKVGYNGKEIKQLHVKQVAGNYILCRIVSFNGNETSYEWKDGSDFTHLYFLEKDNEPSKM